MVESQEMLSQQAQMLAARESELAAMNAQRLANWQARYWHRCVEVPTPRDPPKWPAVTVEKPKTDECVVTPLRKARK